MLTPFLLLTSKVYPLKARVFLHKLLYHFAATGKPFNLHRF